MIEDNIIKDLTKGWDGLVPGAIIWDTFKIDIIIVSKLVSVH